MRLGLVRMIKTVVLGQKLAIARLPCVSIPYRALVALACNGWTVRLSMILPVMHESSKASCSLYA